MANRRGNSGNTFLSHWSMCLFLCQYHTVWLLWLYNIVWHQETWHFILFQGNFAYPVSFMIPYKFQDYMFQFHKKMFFDVFRGITMNRYTALGIMGILTVLNPPNMSIMYLLICVHISWEPLWLGTWLEQRKWYYQDRWPMSKMIPTSA